jgi:hypothetical protein
VTNLPDGTTEHDLRRLFSPFGVVYRVSLSPPAEADHPVGIVQLDRVEDAEVAIGWLDGDVYGGLALGVEWAEPFVPPPRSARPACDGRTSPGPASAWPTSRRAPASASQGPVRPVPGGTGPVHEPIRFPP